MLNFHVSYKPPISWWILTQSGGNPRQFSHMKFFRALEDPVRVYRKEVILQGVQINHMFYCSNFSCLRIKGGGGGT